MPDPQSFVVRDAVTSDVEPLAQLWHAGWQDAHAELLPALAPLRTLASLRDRLIAAGSAVRLVEREGRAAGLAWLIDDEVNQFYVAAEARGTGAAQVLMHDVLAQLRARAVSLAWLSCAIGNHRAARFYEKMGWRRARVTTCELSTTAGPFLLDEWRYEHDLTAAPLAQRP